MALGDYVQHDSFRVGNGTTANPQLGVAPTSGNLLILTFGHDSGTGSISSGPTGFTLILNNNTTFNNTGSFWWWYKVSDGTEQTSVSISAPSADTLTARLVEYEWNGVDPTVQSDEDTSKLSTTGNTVTSGTLTPGSTPNIVVAVVASTHDVNSQDGNAFDGTWVEDLTFVGYGGGTTDFFVGHKANATGSQTATFTDTDTGAELWGSIASFETGAVPNITDVNTTESWTDGDTGLVITGTDFT